MRWLSNIKLAAWQPRSSLQNTYLQNTYRLLPGLLQPIWNILPQFIQPC